MASEPEAICLEEIKRGLRDGEFFLEYLPTVSLEDECCVGAEALIRWRRPGGVVMPLEFIPLVEKTPVSGTLTYWVMEQVASELGAWLRVHDDVHLSINVPPEILGRGGLEYVGNKTGLADVAHKIVLEVSERGVPDQLGVDALNKMSAYKVRIALDDVGLSDGNLVLYSRVAVNIIKLDKAFADTMLSPDWSPRQLEALAALIRTTPNLEVVAEGIESVLQVEYLKAAGISMAQGWYFSPPLSAADFKAYHKAHRRA